MAVTEGPWHIGQPGGPGGPFYSLVNPQGRVVAMQIPSKDDAEFMAGADAEIDRLTTALHRALWALHQADPKTAMEIEVQMLRGIV